MAAVGLEPTGESVEKSREMLKPIDPGGAESGALLANPASPALSLLLKLIAGLTADERAALARMLKNGKGGVTPSAAL
jgi:hypothetical protein